MADIEKHTDPVIVAAHDARGALGSTETSRGDTLVPMLVGGLVLVVIGIAVALLVF